MRNRVVLLLAAVIVGACADDLAVGDAPLVCAVTTPTLLAPAPQIPGLEDEMYLKDDWISFRFSDELMPSRRHFIPRCGGEVQTSSVPDDGPRSILYMSFEGDPRVYSFDEETRRLLLLDRIERPGIDTPTDLGILPGEDSVDFHGDGGAFAAVIHTLDQAKPFAAAGVGAATRSVWTHDGDPAHRRGATGAGARRPQELLPGWLLAAACRRGSVAAG